MLVDCLFASGLARPLPDDLFALLTGLARHHHQCVAVDLPSGVETDLEMIRRNEIRDGKTIAAVLHHHTFGRGLCND